MILGDYLEQLKQRRIRITPQRLEILRAILEGTRAAGHPLTAEEILKRVRERYPGVSLDTVYRTLATFVEQGLVSQIQFRGQCRRFELVRQGNHHHHLVCLGCGKTKELPYCPNEVLKQAQLHYPDFIIRDHTFTIYGFCSGCQDSCGGGSGDLCER